MSKIRSLILATGILLPFLMNCGGSIQHEAQPASPLSRLQEVTHQTRSKYQLPGLGAQFRSSEGNWIRTVDGLRRSDRTEPLQVGDRFHLGSNAKAMTATMIATLVEKGRLTWDTRIVDVFSGSDFPIDSGYTNVTLRQLLCHTSGMPPYTEYEDMLKLPTFPGDITAQRAGLTAYILSQPPASTPGSFAYSNAGYVVAAAMAERVTEQSWEKLMEANLFGPLGIGWNTDWPGSDGSAQPWGHWDPNATGHLVPYDPVNEIHFLPLFSPAGDVSMSMEDYGRFLDFHLAGLVGKDGLLKASTVRELHTPEPGKNYAFGWCVDESGGMRVEWHGGGGVQFFAYVILVPTRNYALVVVANSYNSTTEQAVSELAQAAMAIH